MELTEINIQHVNQLRGNATGISFHSLPGYACCDLNDDFPTLIHYKFCCFCCCCCCHEISSLGPGIKIDRSMNKNQIFFFENLQ